MKYSMKIAINPENIYLFKGNIRNTRKRCKFKGNKYFVNFSIHFEPFSSVSVVEIKQIYVC